MQLSIQTVKKDFDIHGGKMTADEFSKSMTSRRKQTSFGAKLTENNVGVIDGRNVKANEQDFLSANKLITAKIFDGRENIELGDYVHIRNQLLHCLWHYEFFQYDVIHLKHGNDPCTPDQLHGVEYDSISINDFARSVFIYMPNNEYKQFMDRMKTRFDLAPEELVKHRITFHEYVTF